MVILVPDPVAVVPPGVLVNVQVPVPGRLLRTTIPVRTVHVGCVIVPTVGGDGEEGAVLITILADDEEVHPDALVTV